MFCAAPSLLPQPSPAPIAAAAPPRPHAALPFALEQLGALSGRLFRLESQAAQLSKRIGILLSGGNIDLARFAALLGAVPSAA